MAPSTYRQAGVDIDAQNEALARARSAIRATFTPGVLGDVGLFGGLFDPSLVGWGDAVLVASADGVGTKLEVAKRAGVYDTVGRDLVHHCIGDILAQGARPLFFLDYVGTGRLEPAVVADLIRGCAEACKDHGLALLGGETAEMPGLYAPGDFDLVGFIVGAVRREKILDGSRVRPGQVLLGLPSNGLHTNGYSLARKVLFEDMGLAIHERPRELGGRTVAEALLEPHRCYLPIVGPLLDADLVAGIAHITGGGIPDNLVRILTDCDAVVDRSAWEVPGIFRLIVEGGGIEPEEAHRVFNMGIGMILVVDEASCAAAEASLSARGEKFVRLGHIAPRAKDSGGAKGGKVRWAE